LASDIDITPEGLDAVKQELAELTEKRRPDIVRKIKAARELGDLSENFEYHAAKNEQGFIESRIAQLEHIVRNARVIQAAPAEVGTVGLGSTVEVAEEGEPEQTYRIVGPAEADPMAGRISNESGLGGALIGRRAGEEVEVPTPGGGSYRVRIVSVS
jgi:transcription elongation factor GreA